MIYVQDMQGKPLMPSERYKHLRWLLSEDKASIVQYEPFVVMLNYETDGATQPITLGVDAGSKHVGMSATTDKKELYASETLLRTDIPDLIATRREARRARRGRKTHYRAARFDNRGRKQGWLPPSVRNKVERHKKLVADVHRILPITKIVVEVGAFDTQKLKDATVSGKGYQQGEMNGFDGNTREYVLWRDNHECQHCHGNSKDPILQVHHIESRKTGGNAPSNLVTLCKTCHEAYHRGEIELKQRRGKSLRDAAAMSAMKWQLFEELKATYADVHMTFGYITKATRIANGLEKSHAVDARCISQNPIAKPCDEFWEQKCLRRHNRQIHKFKTLKGGRRKANQAPYAVKGFRLFDKVLYDGKEWIITGRRSSGSFLLKSFDGTVVKDGVSYKKLQLLAARSGIIKHKNKALCAK